MITQALGCSSESSEGKLCRSLWRQGAAGKPRALDCAAMPPLSRARQPPAALPNLPTSPASPLIDTSQRRPSQGHLGPLLVPKAGDREKEKEIQPKPSSIIAIYRPCQATSWQPLL
ncbi:uncharacterized [Tachysurus ichikawai]